MSCEQKIIDLINSLKELEKYKISNDLLFRFANCDNSHKLKNKTYGNWFAEDKVNTYTKPKNIFGPNDKILECKINKTHGNAILLLNTMGINPTSIIVRHNRDNDPKRAHDDMTKIGKEILCKEFSKYHGIYVGENDIFIFNPDDFFESVK